MRWLADALWLAAAVIAYGTFGPTMAINHMVPVLPIIVIVRVALTSGELPGNLFGFFGGFLVDVFSLEWFGSAMLVDSLIGYTLGAMKNRVVVDNAFMRIGVLFAAAQAHSLGLVLVRSVAGPVGPEPFVIALGSGVYTMVLGTAWWTLAGIGRALVGWRSVWYAER